MGNTFEVNIWKEDRSSGKYGYEDFWRGESFLVAIWKLIKAKREGYGCVTLHWR